jgi:cobalamin biosynthesis Mg chelatase CobN
MKNKSMQLTVLFVLVLFMAQIFTPFVVAQAQSEANETAMAGNLTLPANVSENTPLNTTNGLIKRNRITFVLGTDENLLSLENASIDAAVNATIEVIIYNTTEAKSANFSNESVVFLAALDNETVASINQTLNESAYVFVYNLSSNISIGNVEDANITKYWVYGGDENIQNLIIYMDNKFYGNTTAVDPPIPPEDRTKITFVTTIQKYILLIESAKDDLHISKYINVSSIFVDDSNRNTNVSDQNVIMMAHGRLTKERAEEAKDNCVFIITHMFQDLNNLGNVNTSDPTYSNITTYWDNGGEENIKRLIIFLGVKFCNVSMEILVWKYYRQHHRLILVYIIQMRPKYLTRQQNISSGIILLDGMIRPIPQLVLLMAPFRPMKSPL